MAHTATKVLYLALCSLISLTSSANVEESPLNKVEEEVEDSSDPASRNARYIRYQGNPYYYQNTGGYNPPREYYYPDNRYPIVNQYPGGTTQFYPDSRPNKLDPNYWLSKLPGFGQNPTLYPPSYPNYPGGSGSGTNFIGHNPYPGRYPGGYYPQSGYPGTSTYPGSNYPGSSGYPSSSYPSSGYPSSSYPSSGYPSTSYPSSGYPSSSYPSSSYPGSSGYPGYSSIGYSGTGNGGYGGYQGNGGLTSYSGYDGYYAAGNRPGNIGFGYQNSRTNGIVGPRERLPLVPIATPATVSKDAK